MKNTQKFLLALGCAMAAVPAIMVGCTTDSTCTDDADCFAGETCNNPNGGVGNGNCISDSGEGEGEGEGGVTCSGISDGACLEDRADGADLGLCDPDTSTCEVPQDVTGGCTASAGHTAAQGPVIYEATIISEDNEGSDCTAGYTAYLVSVYSETEFDTSLNSQRLKFYGANGGTAVGTYSEDPGLLPTVTPVGAAAPNYYTMDVYLCGPTGGSDGAIFLTNNDNVAGNAFCMSAATE
jgi:hypothetical protein